MAGRKKRKTVKLVDIFGFDAKTERRKAGAKKAAATKRTKATHKRATTLRNDEAFMAEYRRRKKIADTARRITYSEMRGEPKSSKRYYGHKDYRRALANPENYMNAYGINADGTRKRSRRKK
jgi:hypothetical protein